MSWAKKCRSLMKLSESFANLGRSISSSADNDLRIAYLRESLAPLNKPNYYDFLIAKKPSLAALSRAAVLIPISVRQERNKKGMFVQKSFFTLTKRSDKVNTLKSKPIYYLQ